MKIGRDDLKLARGPLAVAAVLFALGATCLVSSHQYLDAAKKTQDATRLSRVAAQERVLRVSEEEREIRSNLVFYEQMRERGMVSEQNRVEWIESIAGIKRNRKLFEIKYRIDAQSGLDYPGIVATGAGDFTVSRMKLDMLLLHENDLLDFLADLQAARKGYVSVRQCTVTRIDREAPPAPTALQPRLRAECKVDLVAVRGMKPA
jgi:hypothetical protein